LLTISVLQVVAEGTETQEHIKFTSAAQLRDAQGYFFSRPADDQAMVKLLAKQHGARSAAVGG